MATIGTWKVEVDGAEHSVDVDIAQFTEAVTVRVDGEEVPSKRLKKTSLADPELDATFTFGQTEFHVRFRSTMSEQKGYLLRDGIDVETGKVLPPLEREPFWIWIFRALCFFPVVALNRLSSFLIMMLAWQVMTLVLKQKTEHPATKPTLCTIVTLITWLLALLADMSLRAVFS